MCIQNPGLINPEMNIVLGRPRNRCEDNIKAHIMEVECEVVDWIHLVQEGGSNHRLPLKSQYHAVLERAEHN
jgi:hypothetical protein